MVPDTLPTSSGQLNVNLRGYRGRKRASFWAVPPLAVFPGPKIPGFGELPRIPVSAAAGGLVADLDPIPTAAPPSGEGPDSSSSKDRGRTPQPANSTRN